MNQDLFIQRTNQIRELRATLLLGLDDVQDWILTASPQNRARINPFQIQIDTGVNYKKIIAILLAGTLTGAFQINWEYTCPEECGEIASVFHSFTDCKSKFFCEKCNREIQTDLRTNVIISFSVHPEIDDVPFMPPKVENNDMQLSALELLHVPEYKEFFGSDVISPKEQIYISSVAVLFTSIRGSTEMYETLGDIKAFDLVREHFQIINEAIQNNNGTIIKTIGDSVMASFVNSSYAVHSMFKLIEKFKIHNLSKSFTEQINLQMGFHEGPVVLVNANDKLDYFGVTINHAARMHSLASGDEACMAEDTFKRPEIQEILKTYGIHRVKRSKQTLKGSKGNKEIVKIPIQP